jgi:16S rRNA (cytosine1402-N4)-methyltransferase
MTYKHIPVLGNEVLENLIPEEGACRIIDGTVGYGGHSSLILKKNRLAELLGIDRDGEALISARENLSFAENRIHLVRGRFSDLEEHAKGVGWNSVDVILLDVGISSPQIDNPQRGFSFRMNGPLDMRMDQRSPETASRILNSAPEEELTRIFRFYGEIRQSRKLAAAIVAKRTAKALGQTSELVEICESVLGKSKPGKLPTPTLCFQALRIAVNKELEELETALKSAVKLLAPGGRIGVISFHSLEDRIVKQFFKKSASECICPPGLPKCICEHRATLKIITRRPLTASEEELKENTRSASAKLRVAEKLQE